MVGRREDAGLLGCAWGQAGAGWQGKRTAAAVQPPLGAPSPGWRRPWRARVPCAARRPNLARLRTPAPAAPAKLSVLPAPAEPLLPAPPAFLPGRELAKFMASVQAMAYGSHNAELTSAMFRRMVETKVAEHSKRRGFIEAGGGDAPY